MDQLVEAVQVVAVHEDLPDQAQRGEGEEVLNIVSFIQAGRGGDKGALPSSWSCL